jgi:segregation and condensation protein A
MNAAESTPADPDPSSGSILDDLGADPDERTDGLAGYAVKLPVFEGPLDLLLHLIRQNEVDITDIPISRIAEQYLETIEFMQELNLDVAAEYLVMAATLALIKSRMLLPVESEDDEEGSDPRADLVHRLLEYQRFKEAAETLSRRRLLGRDVFDVHGPDLVAAFKEVLESAESRVLSHEVETEPVTVRDRMVVVMELLERNESVEFMQIFLSVDGEGLPSRSVLVATFLAILELARLTAIRIYQGLNERGTPEGPIRVRRVATTAGESDWLDRVTETM